MKEVHPQLSVFFCRISPQATLEANDHPEVKCNGLKHDSSTDSVATQPEQFPLELEEPVAVAQEPVTQITPPRPSLNGLNHMSLFQQLVSAGYMTLLPERASPELASAIKSEDSDVMYHVESELSERWSGMAPFAAFCAKICRSHLIQSTTHLNFIQTRCLQTFVITAFDISRDMNITPKRLAYAKDKEVSVAASRRLMTSPACRSICTRP